MVFGLQRDLLRLASVLVSVAAVAAVAATATVTAAAAAAAAAAAVAAAAVAAAAVAAVADIAAAASIAAVAAVAAAAKLLHDQCKFVALFRLPSLWLYMCRKHVCPNGLRLRLHHFCECLPWTRA
jgi:hypothetical protein